MPETIHTLEAEVLDHQQVAPEHYVLTLDAPPIAARARPGQFVMVRCPGAWDPLLPRAFSLYGADAEGGCISILYREVGRGTGRLRLVETGQSVSVWGPLGNWFRLPEGERVVLVGGGVGVPPLVFWAEYLERLSVPMDVVALVGAATGRYLVGLEHFRSARAQVRVATDDGTAGHRGYVTDLLEEAVADSSVSLYACGPMPMLRAVAGMAVRLEVPAELALEAPMACGIGACLGCTVPRAGGGFLRVCSDGPVFTPDQVDWDGQGGHG